MVLFKLNIHPRKFSMKRKISCRPHAQYDLKKIYISYCACGPHKIFRVEENFLNCYYSALIYEFRNQHTLQGYSYSKLS